MDAPANAPLQDLLDLTLREMGIDAEGCTDEVWPETSNLLLVRLHQWLLDASAKAQAKLRHDLSARLFAVPFASRDRSPHVGGVNLRPPNGFYLRDDSPWARAPEGINGGELYIAAELGGARHSTNPDCHLSPVINLHFHVGYRACEPLKWLIGNWRRPLEKLLLPLKADLDLNGHQNAAVKEFRGNDVVRKAELYLADPGPDPVVGWFLTFHNRTKEKEVIGALSVFLAVYDAIYSLQVKRCDPDRLHRHFLVLEPELPSLPFRSGFYDPGQTRRQLIEDWNRRNPQDPIPLDAKW